MSRTLKSLMAPLLALAAVALLVAGCGGGSNSSPGGETASTEGTTSTSEEPSGEPQAGGRVEIAQEAEIIGLNPSMVENTTLQNVNVTSQIFETLFKEDYEGNVSPWLVESFKPNPANTVWTMQLKKGIDFSNGKPLTSADAKWSIEHSPEQGIENFAKVEAPSPDTLVIKLKSPNAEIPATLTLTTFSIVPNKWDGESEKDFYEHPVGTGPFEFASWKKGEAITLKKNPHYWMPDRPYLDEVVYKTIPSPEARASQVRGGQLDVAYGAPFPELESLEQDPELTVNTEYPGTNWIINLNTETPLFKNEKVREAVNYALDREGMIATALLGHGEPAAAYLLPWVPGFNESLEPKKQDIEKAKALLAEAVKEGVKPSFELLNLGESPFWTQAIQVAQANLEEVGFSVTIKNADISSGIEAMENKEFEAGALLNTEQFQTPTELFGFYIAVRGNWANVDTKEIEQLYTEAQAEPNEAKRLAIWGKAQEVIYDEQAVIPVAWSPYTWVLQKSLVGAFAGKTGILWLGEAGFTG